MLALEHSSRVPLIKDTPTMILGMDVSHGSPGRSDVPSVAAVLTMLLFFFFSLFSFLLYDLSTNWCMVLILWCCWRFQVVGSRSWPLISRYRAAVRTQSPKVEMIDALYKPLANGKDDGIIRY